MARSNSLVFEIPGKKQIQEGSSSMTAAKCHLALTKGCHAALEPNRGLQVLQLALVHGTDFQPVRRIQCDFVLNLMVKVPVCRNLQQAVILKP
jgi:hypothetical protein